MIEDKLNEVRAILASVRLKGGVKASTQVLSEMLTLQDASIEALLCAFEVVLRDGKRGLPSVDHLEQVMSLVKWADHIEDPKIKSRYLQLKVLLATNMADEYLQDCMASIQRISDILNVPLKVETLSDIQNSHAAPPTLH